MIDLSKHKLKLNYPCIWKYKIISQKQDDIEIVLKNTLQRKYKITKSNTSKKGKFISYNLELRVKNEQDRLSLYSQLNQIDTIIRVL